VFGGEGEIAATLLVAALRADAFASSKIAPGDFVELTTDFGGEGEIRTHEPRKGLPVFKTGAFNRSATSPFTG
jgi:hypothetical protein